MESSAAYILGVRREAARASCGSQKISYVIRPAPFYYAVIGAAVLVLYGVIPTLQPASFGRVYVAYGGVFVVLSILWDGESIRSRPIGSI